MRAVAAELGVAVMSLYNHVPNKAALMEGVAEYVVAGLDTVPSGTGDWRDGWTAALTEGVGTAAGRDLALGDDVSAAVAVHRPDDLRPLGLPVVRFVTLA